MTQEIEVNGDKVTEYGISDPTSCPISILSGIQHTLAMIGGSLSVPYLLFPYYCIGPDDPARGDLAAAMLFVCGITTILQSAIGSRLPIMQGTTLSYLIPTFIMLGAPNMKCPNENVTLSEANITRGFTSSDEIWQQRVLMVQGSLMSASLLQITLGFTGLIGYALPYITPLVIMPIQALVGFALLEEAIDYCSGNWSIAMLTVVILIIFSEPLKNVYLPTISYSREKRFHRSKGVPIFQLFPLLMAIILVWIICIIFTHLNVFSDGNAARTDSNNDLISRATWFRIPYPTQWGTPNVNFMCFIGMLGSSMANIVEAVGNYYVCARMSKAPPPPIHAVNRGNLIEGIGTFLDGLIGIGNGISSYAENIGIIGMTKMASRRGMYMAGLLMMLIGVFTKLTAVFMIIPYPILGGVFLILFSNIVTMGIGYLQYVDVNSSRNLLVIGFPLFVGLAFPLWLRKHTDAIQTGYEQLDSILTVLLRTGMFLGGLIAFLLDNLLPGTPEERGLVKWNALKSSAEDIDDVTDYDFPLNNFWLKKDGWVKRIPLCPGYVPIRFRNLLSKRKKKNVKENNSKKDSLKISIDYDDKAYIDSERL